MYEKVLKLTDEIIQQMPELPLAWVVKGIEYLGLLRYDDAMGCFDSALRLDPSNRKTKDLRMRTQEYMEEIGGAGVRDATSLNLCCSAADLWHFIGLSIFIFW